MALPVIDTTAGGASANAYCTRSEADQYHLERVPVGTTWLDAQPTAKDAALVYATRLLDTLFEWDGYVVSETQALLWPRSGLVYRSGYTVPSNIIPTELKRACAEFARQLLVSDRMADNDLATQGIRSITAGPISLTFDGTAQTATTSAVPDLVASMVAPWGHIAGGGMVRDLVRV